MGNHVAGMAVGLAAYHALTARKPGETALEILDRVCKLYRNTDAEFEAVDPDNQDQVHPEFNDYTDPHPKACLGMLMLEAFAPDGVNALPRYAAMLTGSDGSDAENTAEELACDSWEAEVNKPFKDRYGFC